MTLSKEEALSLLKEDVIKNLPFIRFLEDHEPTEIRQSGLSILGRFQGTVYISSICASDLTYLLAGLTEKDTFFAALDLDIALAVKAAKGFDPDYDAQLGKYILPLEALLPPQRNNIIPLPPEYAPLVDKHWTLSSHDEDSLDYVRCRLMRGPTAAVFKDERPIGWCATHSDHAPGFIYVEEEFRNQGIAADLTISIIQQQRALGYPTYISIADSNKKSQAVARKLGFKKIGYLWWLGF